MQEKIINNNYWFIIGSFPLISVAEIATVLNLDENNFEYQEPFIQVNDQNINSIDIIQQLGGTVKIAKILKKIKTEQELMSSIIDLINHKTDKFNFGISLYSNNKNDSPYRWGKEIKNTLKEKNISSRFVFNREPILNSASVYHNKLTTSGIEFIVKKNNNNFELGVTEAVQPFEEWGHRDYGRPERDNLSGMLPPKIARIMINLSGKIPNQNTILDPFCGSGTIINEAILMNFKKIIGSDISEKALADTKININWLIKTHKINNPNFELLLSEANQLNINNIDLLVTEPYLGKPLKGRESENELTEQIESLKQLYLNSLKHFYQSLNKGAIIVMIIPRFKFNQNWLRINILDEIKKIGYKHNPFPGVNHQKQEYLLYARDNQKVGREIWKFSK